MTFYDINKTKKIIKSNGLLSLNPSGVPAQQQIIQAGILEKLVLLFQGTPNFATPTGTINADFRAPYNLINNITVQPNQQAPIVQASAWMLYLFNMLKYCMENDTTGFVFDQGVGAIGTSPDNSFVNNGRNTVNPTGTQNQYFQFPVDVPVLQRMLNEDVGYWELDNVLTTLAVQISTVLQGTTSPYSMGTSASPILSTEPFNLTGTATATLAGAVADILRVLWTTPEIDKPDMQMISVVLEDAPQGSNVAGSKQVTYKVNANSGYLARLLMFVYDGNISKGVFPSNMTNILFSYGDNTQLMVENPYEALYRQRYELGLDLPQGAFYYDFLGKDCTWQNVFDTYNFANATMQMNIGTTALGTGSFAQVLKQLILPLQYA
jgi:hypothetical protein